MLEEKIELGIFKVMIGRMSWKLKLTVKNLHLYGKQPE